MFPNRKYVVNAICDSDDCWLNASNSMICVWHVKWTNKCFFDCASFFQLLLKEYVFLLFSFLACSIKTRWIWNERFVQFESDLFCAIPLSYSNIFDYYQHVVLLWKSGIRMTDFSHLKLPELMFSIILPARFSILLLPTVMKSQLEIVFSENLSLSIKITWIYFKWFACKF